jgi:hypothetical protein
LVSLDHHLSWDSFFIVWGDANGKFTYVPKYKPEISKMDYTNLSLCQIPSRSRYIHPRFELMELTFLSVDLFAQRYELTINFLPKLRMKVNQTFNFSGLGDREEFFVKYQTSHKININLYHAEHPVKQVMRYEILVARDAVDGLTIS